MEVMIWRLSGDEVRSGNIGQRLWSSLHLRIPARTFTELLLHPFDSRNYSIKNIIQQRHNTSNSTSLAHQIDTLSKRLLAESSQVEQQ